MRAVAANLLMDMVEQCGLVTSLYDQKQTHDKCVGTWRTSQSKDTAKKLTGDLEAACNQLGAMHRQAVDEGIHLNIMSGILTRNLPKTLVLEIEVPEGD